MRPQPYILARTFSEAHSFARDYLGLKHGEYRVVNTPSTLKSVRGADLILAPGWEGRFDRFAMKGALRWTRMDVIDAKDLDDLIPAGEQMALVEAPTQDPSQRALPEPELVDEVAAKRRARRRRCDECGLLIEPGEVEAHTSEHLPVGVR